MTVMPANAPGLHDDVAGLHALGVNQFLIGYATGVPWTDSEMETFGLQMRKLRTWYGRAGGPDPRITEFDKPKPKGIFGCQAGRTSISVSPTGEVQHGLTHLGGCFALNYEECGDLFLPSERDDPFAQLRTADA